MTHYERFLFLINEKEYFSTPEKTKEIYEALLEENDLNTDEDYFKATDEIAMLEAVFSLMQMLANNIEIFCKVETEFATTTAAYQYLQKRLADLRSEIDRLKRDTHYEDANGNVSSLVGYMFFNGRADGRSEEC